MKRNNSRRAEEDEFLRSLIGPAAEEYAQLLAKKAEDPPLRIPAELDEKCRRIIETHQCSRTSRIRVALVAAVIAALLGMTSFAVYSEVRRELVMKRQEADEGCRITFDGTDEEITEYNIFGDISLGYIPDGFECISDDAETIKYSDENGNTFMFGRRRISTQSTILWNTENATVTPINYESYEGYKSVQSNSADGRLLINIMLFDLKKNIVYDFMSIGIENSEMEKIMEGINFESE